jgi:hypothetical protein
MALHFPSNRWPILRKLRFSNIFLEKALMLPWYFASAVVAKTSLLGLGGISLVLCCVALIALKIFGNHLATPLKQRIAQLFRIAISLHLSVYALLFIKLSLIDGWQDIPAFLLGHLVLHHAFSALIGAILIVMTIRLYNHRHSGLL